MPDGREVAATNVREVVAEAIARGVEWDSWPYDDDIGGKAADVALDALRSLPVSVVLDALRKGTD